METIFGENAYLKTIKQGDNVLLVISNDKKDGEILVDLLEEGFGDLIIPDEVTCINIHLPALCKLTYKFKSVFVPKKVREIHGIVKLFEKVTEIKVDGDNPVYDSRDNCNAIIETETDTLIYGCGKTIVPNGVTKIGDYAFSGCENLEEIKLPNSVTSIGMWCFQNSSLKSIIIPDTVTEIGGGAFWGCRALEKISIPAAKIDSNAFYECGHLSEVYFSDSVNCLDMKQLMSEGASYSESREPFKHLKELRFSSSIQKIENLDYYFEDIDTLVFEGPIPETNGSFKECKIKKLIIKPSRKHAGEIPDDIHDALIRDTLGERNFIYGTPNLCEEESAVPGYIKATLAKNEELIDINTKYIISVEPCEYLHYENVGSMIKCAADVENHVAYEIKVHEPCEMINEKISKSFEQLGSKVVDGIGGLINLIEILHKNK